MSNCLNFYHRVHRVRRLLHARRDFRVHDDILQTNCDDYDGGGDGDVLRMSQSSDDDVLRMSSMKGSDDDDGEVCDRTPLSWMIRMKDGSTEAVDEVFEVDNSIVLLLDVMEYR